MEMLMQMFSYPFIVRAFIVGILVSLCAALLGVSLVLKQYSMIGDGLSHVGFGAMAVVWGINGYAQAMIWPPVIRIFAEMVSRERKMKFCVNIVSSQVVGTLASYLLAAVVMWLIGWRAVFGAAAICLCVMSVIWIIGFEKIEKWGKDQEEETADVDNAESTAAKTANTGKQAWLGFGILMVLFPVIIHGMLKD